MYYSSINDTSPMHAWTSKKKPLDKHHQYMYVFIQKPIKCPFFRSSSSSLFPFRHIFRIAQAKNRINSVVLLFFLTTVFRIHQRENWLNKLIPVYYWNWIVNRPPPPLSSYNYSLEKKAVDFVWLQFVGEDRLKQNNHRTYLHFFQSTVFNVYIYMRIEE